MKKSNESMLHKGYLLHRLSLSSKNRTIYALIPKELCNKLSIKNSKDGYMDVAIIRVGNNDGFRVVQDLTMPWDKKLDVICDGLREILEGY